MSDPLTKTSTTLLNRVAGANDESANAEFVRRYTPLVRALARSSGLTTADAEDVSQEVMLAAVQALRKDRYDRKQARFKAWLKGVVFHKIQHARAARARRHGHSPADRRGQARNGRIRRSIIHAPPNLPSGPKEIPDPSPTPDQQFEADFEAKWQQVAYEEALDQVRLEVEPVTYQAFDLYVRKDLPPAEVAKLLGLSRNAVYIAKSRVQERVASKIAEANSPD